MASLMPLWFGDSALTKGVGQSRDDLRELLIGNDGKVFSGSFWIRKNGLSWLVLGRIVTVIIGDIG